MEHGTLASRCPPVERHRDNKKTAEPRNSPAVYRAETRSLHPTQYHSIAHFPPSGKLGIQPAVVRVLARQLSGGNLQKMVLAREFYRRPRLIIAEQPTQGLDVAATEDVWNVLLKAREKAGILLLTGDLTEALSLSDRIAVMFDGQIMDTFHISDTKKLDQIGLMMAGVSPN